MSPDEGKTKGQLISELVEMRQRVAELETSEVKRQRAEEALKESHGFIEKVTDSLPDVIYVYDLLREENVYASKSLNNVLGYTPEEFKGMGDTVLGRLFHPDDLGPFMEYLEKLKKVKGNKVYQYEYRMKHKDGHWVWIQNRDMIFARDSKGKPLQTIGTAADITERWRVEGEVRESEERYRNLVENAMDVIFTHSLDGTITSLNPAFETATGWSCSEWIGKKFVSIVHPDDLALATGSFESTPQGEKSRIYEARFLGKSGEYSVGEVRVTPQTQNERMVGVWGIVRDITERRRVEAELRESEERYRALVNLGATVGEAIVMLQDNERGDAMHIFVSNEWPRVTGYSRKELLGMSFFDLLHPEHREASLKRHGRKMRGEIVPGLFEMSIIRKDGTEVPVEVTSAYTTYKGERANVAFIRDITERKQAEEREKEVQQELNLSSRLASIGELAAGVAHEINNPLTGILGFSERLMRKSAAGEIRRDLERIHNEAWRAARVVENLLTFARRREPKKEYLDINEILARTVELRAYELRTGNIDLVTELTPSLPKTVGDFGQIQQVFLNIILNAEQAMTEANRGGKLTIKSQRGKGCIRVSFADDGPGIAAGDFDRVFDPFFTTRGERGGTGLGLSACHGIVTEHGGRIYVRSKPGQGATFYVELPLADEEARQG